MSGVFFLYGTLKSNHRNHHLLLPNDMRLIADRVLAMDFGLAELCNGVPVAIPTIGSAIYGQLWLMGKDNMLLMEQIELGYEKMIAAISTVYGEIHANIWAMTDDPMFSNKKLNYNHWSLKIEQDSFKRGLINAA